jgi:hypothetical protein
MVNFDIPDASNISSVADWIEFSITYENSSISKSAVSSKIEGGMGEEPNDTFLSSIWDELEVRMNLYGNPPPFICSSLEVTSTINWTSNPEYLMCLILALTGNSSDPTPSGKLFERISMEAAKHYIKGNAIIFGHPRLLSILEICQLTNERFKSELPSNYKDRGLDVIAWKPFDDNRGNQIIILMQCAGGYNWTSKTGDVILRTWKEKYMTFGCTPIRGFSTVVVISDRNRFEEISFETDLLFDRPRIYRNTRQFELDITLRPAILDWCNNRLKVILN